MGGNTIVFNKKTNTETEPTKIPLKEIGRSNFTKKFIQLFKKLNKDFYKETGKYIWVNEKNLESGFQFNGSTSYIFDPSYDDLEIIKYKETAGDIDLMIPKERAVEIWHFLDKLEGKEIIKGVTYAGMNRMNPNNLGDTMITVFVADFNGIKVPAQVDLELSDVDVKGNPTEWARFAHSSSFRDAKAGVKAVHHKYLIQSLMGAVSLRPDIVIATPASKAGKIRLKKFKANDIPRMLKFSVSRGVGAAYVPIYDEDGEHILIDGKKVYRETKTSERDYTTAVKEIYKLALSANAPSTKEMSDFGSFIGVVDLIKSKLTKAQIKDTNERYFNKLWGIGSQVLEKDPESDYHLKISGYNYFNDKLGTKGKQKLIDEYYKNFEKYKIKAVFHEGKKSIIREALERADD